MESEILEECLHDANEEVQRIGREWQISPLLV
jgi:hypothetical protein